MHRRVERRAALAEIGNELRQARRIEHRARQQVRARLPRLLQDRNRQIIAARLPLERGQTQRRRQAGRSPADNEHVDFECVAFHRVLGVSSARRARLLLELGDERGRNLEEVAGNTVVGDLEDGRVGILVDGDDRARPLHAHHVLNRT